MYVESVPAGAFRASLYDGSSILVRVSSVLSDELPFQSADGRFEA